MTDLNFDIGQRVTWTIGRGDKLVECKGIFYDKDTEDSTMSIVQMITVSGSPFMGQQKVLTTLLNKDD